MKRTAALSTELRGLASEVAPKGRGNSEPSSVSGSGASHCLSSMQVSIDIDAGPGSDRAEVADLVVELRNELVEHELDPTVVGSAAPPGAKGALVELGSTMVVLAASGGVLTTLVGTLQAWLLRHAGSRIAIELDGDKLELTDATDEERRRAVALWLARHEGVASEARGGDTSPR